MTRLRMTDIAPILGVTRRRVQRMYHDGQLPAPVKMDGRWPMWNPKAIERWAEREWWGTRPWRKRS